MSGKVIFKLVKPFDGISDMARYGSERTYSKDVVSGSVNEVCFEDNLASNEFAVE